MAAPSSSPPSTPSPSHHGADAPLGSAHLCAFQRSISDDAQMSMALDRDGFPYPAELLHTLGQHHAVFSLIERMDEFWFFDSIDGSSSQESTSFSPFQSREIIPPEMMTCVDAKKDFSEINFNEASSHDVNNHPTINLDSSSPCEIGKSFEGECLALNPSNIDEECCSIPLISWIDGYEVSCIDSTEELCELAINEKESDNVAGGKPKQANEIFEFKACPEKKLLNSSRLKAVNSNTAEPVRNATKAHISRRRRILKERKKLIEKSTAFGA